jgi:hypothetical protein
MARGSPARPPTLPARYPPPPAPPSGVNHRVYLARLQPCARVLRQQKRRRFELAAQQRGPRGGGGAGGGGGDDIEVIDV